MKNDCQIFYSPQYGDVWEMDDSCMHTYMKAMFFMMASLLHLDKLKFALEPCVMEYFPFIRLWILGFIS